MATVQQNGCIQKGHPHDPVRDSGIHTYNRLRLRSPRSTTSTTTHTFTSAARSPTPRLAHTSSHPPTLAPARCPFGMDQNTVTSCLSWLLVCMLATFFVSEIVWYELGTKGLWASSNGRWLSFCDSLYSMFRYRGLKPKQGTPTVASPATSGHSAGDIGADGGPSQSRLSPGTAPRRHSLQDKLTTNFYYIFADGKSTRDQLAVLWWAFMVKFGGGTIVSLILGEVPTWLQGPRHIGSFLVSFFMIQGAGGVVHDWIRGHFSMQVLLYSSCALYKMRKVVFVLQHPAISDTDWFLKTLVALVTLEGGSISRRVETWRSGVGLGRMWSDLTDPKLFAENMLWVQQQFWIGLTAVILIGAGQKCWFCPHTSWSDYAGQGWTPLPVKFAEDTAVGVLTYADDIWGTAAELYFHPIALCLLVFRFLRQLEWSRNLSELDLMGTMLGGLGSVIILLAGVSFARQR
eukprot:m.72631 g.72631  ORF g.72631 m.72631 type:complete len:460 (-) comp18745_c0_seq1:2275-3654(-)